MDWTVTGIEDTQFLGGSSGAGDIVNAFGPDIISPVFDVRQFASYYFSMQVTTNVAPATAYNPIRVLFLWATDSSFSSLPVYADEYEIFSGTTSGAVFLTPGGQLMVQDVMHGPFMRYRTLNNNADQIVVNHALSGTNRVLSPFAKEVAIGDNPVQPTADTFIIDTSAGAIAGLAAAATTTRIGLMRYGRCRWRVTANNNWTINIFSGSLPNAIDSLASANPLEIRELVIPKRSCRVTITNNSAGVFAGNVSLISQNDKV